MDLTECLKSCTSKFEDSLTCPTISEVIETILRWFEYITRVILSLSWLNSSKATQCLSNDLKLAACWPKLSKLFGWDILLVDLQERSYVKFAFLFVVNVQIDSVINFYIFFSYSKQSSLENEQFNIVGDFTRFDIIFYTSVKIFAKFTFQVL